MSSMSSIDHRQLSFFIVNGDTSLGKLIQGAERHKGRWNHRNSRTKEAQEIIDHVNIVRDIRKLLEDYKRVQGDESTSLDGRCVAKVLKKIEAILKQIIKDDPTSEQHYDDVVQELASKANDLLEKSSSSSSSSSVSGNSLLSWQNQDDSTFKLEFEAALGQLDDKQRRCLSFCCLFFSTVFSVDIKKRDLIHWWIGMDLIENPSEGEDVLNELVKQEFILHSYKNRTTPSSWYTINASVLSNTKEVELLLSEYGYKAKQENRHFIAYNNSYLQEVSTEPEKMIAAAINIGAYTLSVKTFEWLFKMKNAKLLHLSSWHHNMDYVVVEHIATKLLKALKNLKELRFLSFQGISRMEELPKSVYSLTKLKVLDLRGCQDLRLFPKGIESLQQLTHLDLSECYQLACIPKGITSLSKLNVLKGFVINSDNIADHQNPSSCAFSDLSRLHELTKLTVRTRRMSFPTNQDVQILDEMQQLKKLKIAWVSSKSNIAQTQGNNLKGFPMSLNKLELQAAPDVTASRLLGIISNRRDNYLEKLYITGGGLLELDIHKYCFPHVKVVRFRHMLYLHIDWHDFKRQFPSLTRVEKLGCPNFIFFPCNSNGVWESNN